MLLCISALPFYEQGNNSRNYNGENNPPWLLHQKIILPAPLMCLSWSVDYKFSKEEGTSLVHLSHDRVSQMRHFKMSIGWMKGFPVFLSCSDTQRDTLFIYDVLWHELTYLVNVNLSWRMFASQTGCHFTSLYSSLESLPTTMKKASFASFLPSQVHPSCNFINEYPSSSVSPSSLPSFLAITLSFAFSLPQFWTQIPNI